ncbi:MAG: nuclear transport factor 2 family protein [Minwuia sp.]|uniref:nuclear transport factor 2 family protein n=1 Tax=Minwuia sp. TaxID=2493630 RepID=UPI003A83DCE9
MSVSGEQMKALLEANAEFYRAFRTGDVTAMSTLWAEDEDIVCIHPGHAMLQGRSDVLSAWFDILSSPPPVAMCEAQGQIEGGAGIVVCTELIDGARLSATNLFRWDGDEWRMVHHHASQIFEPSDESDIEIDVEEEELPGPSTIH